MILSFLFLGLTSHAAWSATALDEINSQRVAYCQFFTWDKLCGGDSEEARTRPQKDSREALASKFRTLSAEILDSSTYITNMAQLENAYAKADENKRATIQALSIYLNQGWLTRHSPGFENWLSEADHENLSAVASGWALYSIVFAATPSAKNVAGLHGLLRARLPWIAIGMGSVAAAGALLPALAPTLPPPPFQLLRFANTEELQTDYAAHVTHADFHQLRDKYSLNAAALATVMAGPNWQALAGLNVQGRFAFLHRFFHRATYSLRLTPLSFIAGIIAGLAVNDVMTSIHTSQLVSEFENVDETNPLAAQGLSVALNGLHLMALADIAAEVKETNKLVGLLLQSTESDRELRRRFNARTLSDTKYRLFLEHPNRVRALEYANSLREKYGQLAKAAEAFSTSLDRIQTTSPLKLGILARRKTSLQDLQASMIAQDRGFPMDAFTNKLLALYEGQNPHLLTERPRHVN